MGYIDLFKKKEEESAALKAKALQESERLASLLKEKFKFDTLYLTGSLIREKRFSRHSDIDFVIRGLKIESFFKAFSLLISKSTFHVDLKPYEELTEKCKCLIEKEGRLLR